MKVFVTLS